MACRERDFTRDELLSLTIADIDNDIRSVEYFKTEIWANEESSVGVRTHVRKDGSTFPVEIISNLIDMDDQTGPAELNPAAQRFCTLFAETDSAALPRHPSPGERCSLACPAT